MDLVDRIRDAYQDGSESIRRTIVAAYVALPVLMMDASAYASPASDLQDLPSLDQTVGLFSVGTGIVTPFFIHKLAKNHPSKQERLFGYSLATLYFTAGATILSLARQS